MLKLVFVLSFGYWVVAVLALALLAPSKVRFMWTETLSQIHLANTGVGLVLWLFTRGGKKSAAVLDAVDALSVVGICMGWALMVGAAIPLPPSPSC